MSGSRVSEKLNLKVLLKNIKALLSDYLKLHPLPQGVLSEDEVEVLLFTIHQTVFNSLPVEVSNDSASSSWYYDKIGLLVRQLRSQLTIQH
jgi:hypothetical protein